MWGLNSSANCQPSTEICSKEEFIRGNMYFQSFRQLENRHLIELRVINISCMNNFRKLLDRFEYQHIVSSRIRLYTTLKIKHVLSLRNINSHKALNPLFDGITNSRDPSPSSQEVFWNMVCFISFWNSVSSLCEVRVSLSHKSLTRFIAKVSGAQYALTVAP
jgi:hypothetical protein